MNRDGIERFVAKFVASSKTRPVLRSPPMEGHVRPPRQPRHRPRPSSTLFAHLPLLLTMAAFLFVIINVYRVSGSDTATAQTVVSAAGVPSVILGALVATLPQIATLVMYTSALLLLGQTGTPAQRRVMWELVLGIYSRKRPARLSWRSERGDEKSPTCLCCAQSGFRYSPTVSDEQTEERAHRDSNEGQPDNGFGLR